MKKITLFILILIFALSGCVNTDTKLTSVQQPLQQPVPGGVLKIYSYNPDTFNPLFTQNNANQQMLHLIFESLIVCNQKQQPEPFLAESYTVSQDGYEWNIYLKKNIKWHDGEAFTAYDVENTFNTVISGVFSTVYANNLSNVSKISVLDNAHLKIVLKKPQTNFINLLDIPIIKRSKTPSKDNFSPVGTGPYIYGGQANKSIMLNVNKNWWGENIPYIDSVEVKLLQDKNTSIFAYESKEIDVVTTDMQNWGRYSGNSENNVSEYPSGNFNFLNFNLNNKFLLNIEFRKAIAHSINKKRILDEVLLSHGVLTETFISPNWWMYNENTTKYDYNLEHAKEIIDLQGINTRNLSLELLVYEDNEIKTNVASILKECLMEVGVNLNIRYANWEDYSTLIKTGSYDMYLGEINYSTEVNPYYILKDYEIYNEIISQLEIQNNDDGRKQKYCELQDMLVNNLTFLPLYFDASALLYNSKVLGEIKPLRTNMFNNIHKWYMSNL